MGLDIITIFDLVKDSQENISKDNESEWLKPVLSISIPENMMLMGN